MQEPTAALDCPSPSAPRPEAPSATPFPSRKGVSRWPLRLLGLFLPGGGQLANGEGGKAAAYLLLGGGSLSWAILGNRSWLQLYWKFKELEASSVFLRDYYADKQEALFTFLGLYVIVLVVSNFDALLNRPSPPSTE